MPSQLNPIGTLTQFQIFSRSILNSCCSWGAHSDDHEEYYLWDITPCSHREVHRRFEEIYCMHLQEWRVSQARSQQETNSKQTMNMEAVCSSETSMNFYRTTRRKISGDSTLHILRPIFLRPTYQLHWIYWASVRSLTSTAIGAVRKDLEEGGQGSFELLQQH
jgi:hypothetical protein